jgi:regulator of replication initiation timing
MDIQQALEKSVAKAKEEIKKQEKINERDNVISRYGKIFHFVELHFHNFHKT